MITCHVCGKSEEPSWGDDTNAEMRRRSLCFTCLFWTHHLESPLPHSVVIAGVHYVIGDEAPLGSTRGFGGQRYVIRFPDGSVTETTNLWMQGRIPDAFREQLPDTAAFVRDAVGAR